MFSELLVLVVKASKPRMRPRTGRQAGRLANEKKACRTDSRARGRTAKTYPYPYRRSAACPGHPARAQAQLLRRSPGPRPRPSSAHACSGQLRRVLERICCVCPHTQLAVASTAAAAPSSAQLCHVLDARIYTHAHTAHAPSTARSYRSMHRLHLILMDRFLFSYTYCD